jgi:hypothetical protein
MFKACQLDDSMTLQELGGLVILELLIKHRLVVGSATGWPEKRN